METAYREALKGMGNDIFPRRSATALNRLETGNLELLMELARPRRGSSIDVLRSQLREMTGRRHILFAPSARCALAQVLSILPHNEVVLPAWTCPVVQKAAHLAGKDITYVDVAKEGINANARCFAQHAKPGRVLIPTHLFGIPTDINRICGLARERGCISIEDAAAAFPAWLGNQMVGTFGDVGILSFERSKRVPSFRGAAIIVNNDQAIDVQRLDRHRVVPTSRRWPLRELLFSIEHNIATIPWLYGRVTVPRALRQFRAQEAHPKKEPLATDYDIFYSGEFHPYQAALASAVLRRIGRIRTHIGKLVEIYRDSFQGTPIKTFLGPVCDSGGLLRFPIVCPGKTRAEFLRASLRRSLFLETNFESPLPDEADMSSFPNAQWAARNVVLLPLYSTLPEKTAKWIADQVIEIQSEISCRQPEFSRVLSA